MEIRFRVADKDPGQLEDILEAFKKKCSADDLEQILKNMHAYANEGLNGEDSTHHNYLANLIKGKENTYQTYLNFMGICFYYHDKKLTNYAWYYYSRAEYFKGIHESWNYIIKHEDAIYFNKNEKNNPEKELSDLDIEISNFLQKKNNDSQKQKTVNPNSFIAFYRRFITRRISHNEKSAKQKIQTNNRWSNQKEYT